MNSQTDFLKMQSKLRNNNEDIESFMREINSWQEEMSAKDNQLSKKEVRKGNTKSQDLGSDKENTLSQLIQRASVEKDKGNEHFKKGEYQKAIDCYTEGLKCDPRSAILAANRAMALLKLNREREAEKDCTLAITLDPTYAKAYIRRAYARSGLKRYSDAITDYEKVLEIEPKNKMAKTEMEKLLQRKESGDLEQKVTVKSTFEQNMKNAFQKKPSKSVNFATQPQGPSESEGSDLLREVSTKKLMESSNAIYPCEKPPHKRSKKPMKRMSIVDVMDEKPKETLVEDIIEKDLSQSLEEIVQVSSPKKPKEETKVLFKPCNSVQFYCTWRNLENDAERRKYLGLIPPKEYATLFRHSLESDVFSSMIRVLKEEFLSDANLKQLVPDILLGLSKVDRLSVLLMFLGAEEKESLNFVLDSIKEFCDPCILKGINKHFG